MPTNSRKRRHSDSFEIQPPSRSRTAANPNARTPTTRAAGSRCSGSGSRLAVKRETTAFNFGADDDGLEVIDLLNDKLPEALQTKDEDINSVKISGLNCSICMEVVTGLTVTHCGHLFCSKCLHTALNYDANKKICPICRQKIDAKPASGKYTQRSKGIYSLELKLMTKKKLGKQPASRPGTAK